MDNVSEQVNNGAQLTKAQRLENALATGYVSINQAADIWGKNKGTISTHVKEGKLQKQDQPLGPPKLMVAQLVQVYGDPNVKKQVENALNVTTSQPHATVVETGEIKALEAALAAKEEVIAVLRETLAEERRNTERERATVDHLREVMKALPAPTTTAATLPEAAPISAAQPPKRGLFGLFKRAG